MSSLGFVPRKSDRSQIPVIGVTGAIGSGKSTVARLFGTWGGIVLSGDRIGHHVVEQSPALRRRLAMAFGPDIFRAGRIDRRLLGRRAFAAPKAVLTLNRLVHPPLIRELNRQIRAALKKRGPNAVIIDAALLVEWGIGKIHWDFLVGVDAPHRTRIDRLKARGLTNSQIRQFTRAQMPWNRKRAYCDFIVKNDATAAILRRRARLCWEQMLSFNQL